MDDQTQINAYIDQLALTHPLRAPVIHAAIESLQLAAGSAGLDAGCGIGLHTALLANAIGPAGHITNLDLCPEFLECARTAARITGLTDRVTFRQGDVMNLPFEGGMFDWVWSVDCLGYATPAPIDALRGVRRVLRSGGRVMIMIWSSERLLPGYPGLEARLNATSAGIAPFSADHAPDRHWLRAPGWLRQAGFREVTVRTFAGDVFAPMHPDRRDAITALMQMRWAGAEAELGPADRDQFERLSSPESPDFIVDRPDYYAFFTYSLFTGWVGESM
jgi:SAM-dependent methyltransferase